MKLSVKLPNMSLLRGQIPEDLSEEDRMRRLLRNLRKYLVWGALGTVFFVLFAWMSLPTRAVAWRISHEAMKAGFKIDIEDISVRPWGTLILHNVVWTFEPTRPQIPPAQYHLDEVEVDVGMLSLMMGTLDVEIETQREEGRIWAHLRRASSESKLALKIEDLPLYDVPKAAPALGVPLFGIVAFDAELVLPEQRLSKAEGKIEISCSGCRAGDGESKLFIPGAQSLARDGLTLPEVDLGTLTGRFVVEDGKARLDPPITTESEDLKIEVTGRLLLRDVVARSQFNMVLKVQLTEAFQERSEAVRFMYQGASPKSRLDLPEEGLGFRLEGTLGRPRFLGIKSTARKPNTRTAQASNRARPSPFTPGTSTTARRPSVVGTGTAPTPPEAAARQPAPIDAAPPAPMPEPEREEPEPEREPPAPEPAQEQPPEPPPPEELPPEPEPEPEPTEEPAVEPPEEIQIVDDGAPEPDDGDQGVEIVDDGAEAPPEADAGQPVE